MQKKDINDIVYLINAAREQNQPMPIVFLGAGASVSAGIPLANDIIKYVLSANSPFSEKSKIKVLTEEKRKEYAAVMDCLSSNERADLFREYINKPYVKVNPSHIYLAQLLKADLVDYVLTVNFDNLMLRASALFNFIPPFYDLASLKEFTTDITSEEKPKPLKNSIIYLHGQHHGLYLSNTNPELEDVQKKIPFLLNSIKDRPWIIVGYSGSDLVLEAIANLAESERFNKPLYWVGHYAKEPSVRVQNILLNKGNTYWVSGYDSDSFFLKLHTELKLDTPEIFNKPFSFLKGVMSNIKDIDINENKYLLTGNPLQFIPVKQRLDFSNVLVADAISRYEELKGFAELKSELQIKEEHLFLEVTEAITKKQFDKADHFKEEANKSNNDSIKNEVSGLFNNWGNALYYSAETTNSAEQESLFDKCFDKYKTATELNPKFKIAFRNWGKALGTLAIRPTVNKDKQELLLSACITKYETVKNMDTEDDVAFSDLGHTFATLARLKTDDKDCQKDLFGKSFGNFTEATKLNPKNVLAFNNWGTALYAFAKTKSGTEQESLFIESEEKLVHAKEINGKVYNLACLYAVWGKKEQALAFLESALCNQEFTIEYILADEDWQTYKDDADFKAVIKRFQQGGQKS
jgi:tetratricopeptide (TPR) repeat protein